MMISKSDTLINYFCIFNEVYANEATRLLPQGSSTQCGHSVILESQCYHTVFRQPTMWKLCGHSVIVTVWF